jgi:hypothetical protein
VPRLSPVLVGGHLSREDVGSRIRRHSRPS